MKTNKQHRLVISYSNFTTETNPTTKLRGYDIYNMVKINNKIYQSSLLHSIYSAEWLRLWESEGAQLAGISSYQLMQRAGEVAFRLICWLYPFAHHWLVLAGPGNNGGNSYVIAKLATNAGKQVTVLACNSKNSLSDEAKQAQDNLLAAGGVIHIIDKFRYEEKVDVIIDGILGTELKSAPREPYASIISAVNQHPAPVVSLDIPSGLTADTGTTPGDVIKATHTQTFIAFKLGLLTGKARSFTGQLHYDDLGLSKWLSKQKPIMTRLTADMLPYWLPTRDPCSHKGDNGRLLIIGGDHGMGGAILIAGAAALRTGAGLVKVLTRRYNIPSLLIAQPELMSEPLCNDSLSKGLAWADVVVIGPGLGRATWGKNALHALENFDKPMLWDADALNLLAYNPQKRQNRIITPHPKEAARLLNSKVSIIEMDRLLTVNQLVEYYGGVVVLKGAGTLLATESNAAIADVGNAGMASGGMGDILSGIIGGLLAQKMSLYEAACAGCVIHGITADNLIAAKGTRGLLATDLLLALHQFVNPDNSHRK